MDEEIAKLKQNVTVRDEAFKKEKEALQNPLRSHAKNAKGFQRLGEEKS